MPSIARSLPWGLCVFAVLVVWTPSACVVGGECNFDTECQDDQICENRFCKKYTPGSGTQRQGCQLDTDCPSNQLCVNKLCQTTASLFEITTEPPPVREPNVVANDASSGDFIHETEGAETSFDTSTPEQPPPPPPPQTLPTSSSLSSGQSWSSMKTYRHHASVGQMTPLAPATTVIRSNSYSLRPGVVAVSSW